MRAHINPLDSFFTAVHFKQERAFTLDLKADSANFAEMTYILKGLDVKVVYPDNKPDSFVMPDGKRISQSNIQAKMGEDRRYGGKRFFLHAANKQQANKLSDELNKPIACSTTVEAINNGSAYIPFPDTLTDQEAEAIATLLMKSTKPHSLLLHTLAGSDAALFKIHRAAIAKSITPVTLLSTATCESFERCKDEIVMYLTPAQLAKLGKLENQLDSLFTAVHLRKEKSFQLAPNADPKTFEEMFYILKGLNVKLVCAGTFSEKNGEKRSGYHLDTRFISETELKAEKDNSQKTDFFLHIPLDQRDKLVAAYNQPMRYTTTINAINAGLAYIPFPDRLTKQEAKVIAYALEKSTKTHSLLLNASTVSNDALAIIYKAATAKSIPVVVLPDAATCEPPKSHTEDKSAIYITSAQLKSMRYNDAFKFSSLSALYASCSMLCSALWLPTNRFTTPAIFGGGLLVCAAYSFRDDSSMKKVAARAFSIECAVAVTYLALYALPTVDNIAIKIAIAAACLGYIPLSTQLLSAKCLDNISNAQAL